MKHILTLLVLFTTSIFFPVFTQTWTKVQHWGGTGTEICTGLVATADGGMALAGSFEKQIQFENYILNAVGEEDVFICKFDPNGEVAWAKRAGSRLEDEITEIAADANNNLVIVGSYWLEGDFDTITLSAGDNPKSIFVAKYNANGQALWAKTLNGTGLKGVEDVVVDSENNILLTGYFEKNLQIADTSLSASGITDLFLAKFSSDGQLLWAVRQGKKGDTRGTALGLTASGDAIVAGFYNDSTNIADTILTSGTLDQEAFVARFDKNGVPLWAKKAGGVFDSDVTGLVLDEQGNIYIVGYFIGVMRLNSNLSIQSSSGNSDFFLLKYQADGTPLAARAFGGRLLEQALDVHFQNNILLVSGFYQGDIALDGLSLSTGNSLSGFVAGFDLNLQAKWLKNLASDAFLYAAQVMTDAAGNMVVSGSFTGKATFDELQLLANDFDVFVAKAHFFSTSIKEKRESPLFQVFPNPTQGQLFIQTTITNFSCHLINSKGEIVFSGKNVKAVDGSLLAKGVYFITFHGNFIPQTFQVIWN